MRQRFRNKKRRIERQEEATARQATYDALSLVQKIERARAGGGKRELERLFGSDLDIDLAPIGGVRLA